MIGAGTSTKKVRATSSIPASSDGSRGAGGADVDLAKANRLQGGIVSVERNDISEKGLLGDGKGVILRMLQKG